jgi:hypothetical protein
MVAIKRNSERERESTRSESRLRTWALLIGFARPSYMPRFVDSTISLARAYLPYAGAADTAA